MVKRIMVDKNRNNSFMANNIIGFFTPAKILCVIEDNMSITQVYKKLQPKDRLTSPAGISTALTHLVENGYIIKKQISKKPYNKRSKYLFLTESGYELQEDIKKIFEMIQNWKKEEKEK